MNDERLEDNFKGYCCISARRECHFERDSPLKFSAVLFKVAHVPLYSAHELSIHVKGLVSCNEMIWW